MADAEIIPLGTRGRPGRGTGRQKPSASSRSLAPGQPKMAPAKKAPQPETDPAVESESVDTREPDERPTQPSAAPAVTQDRPSRTLGLPIAEVMAALGNAATEVFGDDADRKLAETLAFLRRRVTGDYTVDEYGLDSELSQKLLMAAVAPLAEKWFRVEVRGVENIPTDTGALIVSNHSGTIPVDGIITMYSVLKHTGRHIRPLGADLVFRLPFVSELARKGGATLACNEDAVRMLARGELAAVWPEGFKGIGKPYSERYKLQRFGRGGFVSAAVRTGVPIVPCSVVGAEEIYPLIGNVPALARLVGAPYVPITPFFPLLGPLGLIPLPSKWIIEFGEPIRTDVYDPAQSDDPMLTFDVTDQVRETIQQTLYTLLMQRKSVFH